MEHLLIESVLAVLGAGGGAVFLWKLVSRKAKPHIANLRALQHVPELIEHVEKIMYEVGKNHGKSLRDTVDRIEARLLFVDHRAWALLQDVEHAILETDNSGRLRRMNRTYLRWTGRSQAELLGDGWKNAIHLEDRAQVVAEWESAVKDKRDVELTFNLLDVDGKGVPVRAQCYRIPGDNTNLGWVANIYKLQH